MYRQPQDCIGCQCVQQELVLIVRQEPSPFQGKCYIGRNEVHDIAHVSLVLCATSCDEIVKIGRIDSVRGVALPFFGKIELQLHPSASRTDAPISRLADRRECLRDIAAEDSKRVSTEGFAGEYDAFGDRLY